MKNTLVRWTVQHDLKQVFLVLLKDHCWQADHQCIVKMYVPLVSKCAQVVLMVQSNHQMHPCHDYAFRCMYICPTTFVSEVTSALIQ